MAAFLFKTSVVLSSLGALASAIALPASAASSTCPTFPGLTNPLVGASESFCCTAAAPCGTPQAAGAEASFYSMAGGTGACGQSLPDSAMFVAVPAQIMGSLSSGQPANPLCGLSVMVKNTQTGQVAQGTVQDKCPGCHTSFGIDLSPAMFQSLAPESQGVFPVEWWFVSF